MKSLASCGNIGKACRAAGISRQTFYDRRDADPTFAAAADDARDEACDALELEAWRRAFEGCSDALLMFLLKAHRPETYRDNVKHEHAGPDGGPVQHEHRILSEEERQTQILAIIDGARARTARSSAERELPGSDLGAAAGPADTGFMDVG